jgi:hypothetical protein
MSKVLKVFLIPCQCRCPSWAPTFSASKYFELNELLFGKSFAVVPMFGWGAFLASELVSCKGKKLEMGTNWAPTRKIAEN